MIYDLDYAGKYLREYEGQRYTFLGRNMFALDRLRSILAPSDAEEFSDVSFYQRGMDWDVYAQHARAVILRIGQNVWKDTEFERNYLQARMRNLALGGYFFFDGRASPQQQMNVIYEAMQGKYFDMELIIDWEHNYGGAYEGLGQVVKLMQLCEAAGIRCKAVGMYTGYYWFTANSNITTNSAEYDYLKLRPLWLAWYAAASLVRVPTPWSAWTHWQYGTPSVEWGQPTAEIDMNKHNGTRAEFAQRYLGVNGESMPTVDKHMRVTGSASPSLNVRSSGANLGTENDLGAFNLLPNDIVHVVEYNAANYQRFDKLYRDNVLVGLPTSPTGQYWALGSSGSTVYLMDVVYTPPNPTPAAHVVEVYVDGVLDYRKELS